MVQTHLLPFAVRLVWTTAWRLHANHGAHKTHVNQNQEQGGPGRDGRTRALEQATRSRKESKQSNTLKKRERKQTTRLTKWWSQRRRRRRRRRSTQGQRQRWQRTRCKRPEKANCEEAHLYHQVRRLQLWNCVEYRQNVSIDGALPVTLLGQKSNKE